MIVGAVAEAIIDAEVDNALHIVDVLLKREFNVL